MQVDQRFPQRVALIFALCAAGMSANAAETEWNWSAKIGYDRNEGKYGTPLTSHDISTTLTLGLDSEKYGFDLVLPYVAQTGPGRRIVLAGRRLVVLVEPGRTAMGMGDVTLGATRYWLSEESHGVDLDLGGSIKFATASAEKGLGTGKTDYAVQASLGKSFGALGLSMTAGYTFAGKPEGQDLRNSVFASADAHWKIAKAWSLGVTYGYGGAASTGAASSRDVTVYLSHRVARDHRIEVSVIEGRSTQSPDRGVGVTYSVNF